MWRRVYRRTILALASRRYPNRDSIFSPSLDLTLNDFGVRVLRTPVQAPTANAFCEGLVGTVRWERLDYLLPINQRHLRLTLGEFVAFYNRGRPHSALGPGTQEPIQPSVPVSGHRHRPPAGHRITSKRSSADCITIIGCKRRSLSIRRDFRGPHRVLTVQGKRCEAFDLFQQAAAGADPQIAAQSFASLAILHPGHAEQYYRSALEAQKKVASGYQKETAVILNDLAMAIEQPPATASTLSNLGNLLESAGKVMEA
jgi:hypothetical protein